MMQMMDDDADDDGLKRTYNFGSNNLHEVIEKLDHIFYKHIGNKLTFFVLI